MFGWQEQTHKYREQRNKILLLLLELSHLSVLLVACEHGSHVLLQSHVAHHLRVYSAHIDLSSWPS